MPNLCRLVYVSEAVRPFEGADLAALVAAARRRNESVGVTGVLVHGGSSIVQALEGELEDVADRFDVIRADARHRNVQRLLFDFTPERMFPASWMGLVPFGRARMIEAVRFARALRGSGGDGAAAVLDLLREAKTHLLTACRRVA